MPAEPPSPAAPPDSSVTPAREPTATKPLPLGYTLVSVPDDGIATSPHVTPSDDRSAKAFVLPWCSCIPMAT